MGYDRVKLLMQKSKMKTRLSVFSTRVSRLTLISMVVLLVIAGVATVKVRADSFDEKIAQLQQQNNASQALVNQLQSQASSYQDAINKLQAKINALQTAIDTNLNKQASLKQKIAEAQVQLDKEKAVLGDSIRAMYVQGQITTLEMLASSQNLSDFVDKQVYQSSVQEKIKETLDSITVLKQKLQAENDEVEALLKDLQIQQGQLNASKATQGQLLSYNESQQAAYNHKINSNYGKIADLRRQQILLNGQYNIGNFKGDPNNGGYPSTWARAAQDSMIDDWGMYNRECVSYTAYKVHQDYLAGKNHRDMPYWGGVGNANQWDDNARAYHIPVDSNPTTGSIAISNAGAYGHAMYVEAVNGNQIYVQQYNQQLTGQYSEGWRYTTGLVFIHF